MAEPWTALGGDIARALAQVDEIDLTALSPELREKVEATRRSRSARKPLELDGLRRT
jgi:hypothetical protein